MSRHLVDPELAIGMEGPLTQALNYGRSPSPATPEELRGLDPHTQVSRETRRVVPAAIARILQGTGK
jgi:hypothetical protein